MTAPDYRTLAEALLDALIERDILLIDEDSPEDREDAIGWACTALAAHLPAWLAERAAAGDLSDDCMCKHADLRRLEGACDADRP